MVLQLKVLYNTFYTIVVFLQFIFIFEKFQEFGISEAEMMRYSIIGFALFFICSVFSLHTEGGFFLELTFIPSIVSILIPTAIKIFNNPPESIIFFAIMILTFLSFICFQLLKDYEKFYMIDWILLLFFILLIMFKFS